MAGTKGSGGIIAFKLSEIEFEQTIKAYKLDDEKLLKLQFISTHTHQHYDSIQVSIIGKNVGVLDKETIHFVDVVGMYRRQNGLSDIEPHMWVYDNKTSNIQWFKTSQRVAENIFFIAASQNKNQSLWAGFLFWYGFWEDGPWPPAGGESICPRKAWATIIAA